MKHKHKVKTDREKCYSGPVKRPENRAAHGNVCIVATCACGATRSTNVNGWHVERGPWIEPEEVTP